MESHNVTDTEQVLLDAAKDVRGNAYAPYSGFHVGAALLDENGAIHTGCNVENAAYPEGICAEANAIGSMVAAGGKRIVAIASIGGATEIEACTPCGGCRQRILEFSDDATQIILLGEGHSIGSYSMNDLLPAGFRLR
jgi:cytidine deaminase